MTTTPTPPAPTSLADHVTKLHEALREIAGCLPSCEFRLPNGELCEAIAAMGESYGLDDDKTGWGVTVPLSEVAAAVDRVASFQVAMAGAWRGGRS